MIALFTDIRKSSGIRLAELGDYNMQRPCIPTSNQTVNREIRQEVLVVMNGIQVHNLYF